MSEIHYQRLTRSGGRSRFGIVLTSRGSLWLGPDHLLCVETNGYTETYKRFYFRDIQAIIIRQTKRRIIWNAILPVPLAGGFVALVACLSSGVRNEAVIITWLIFLGIIALFLAINNILGSGCACHLRTAVQIEQLPSLYRVPKARRFLEKIRPFIVAAQGGELSAEVVSARMQEWIASSTGAAPAKTIPEDPNAPPRLDS